MLRPNGLLSRAERVLERLSHLRTVQAAVVALLLAARGNLQAHEHRPGLVQDCADLLLEYLQVGELIDVLVSGRAGEAREAHRAAAGNRMAAVRLVGAVLH